jgi:predicted DNA-binding transcriptional regulator YafY
MRADRLLSALLVLQAHGKQTGRELAARREVSERTVHRDMEALGAGVPVFALRGVRAAGSSTTSGEHAFSRLTMLSCAGC